MLRDEIQEAVGASWQDATLDALYEGILTLTKSRMETLAPIEGERRVYYMSAEFLIGKLLVNNLMNLGIYDDVAALLQETSYRIGDLESYEPEPSLGNGGLGRLAACFLDSIATLGIPGEGLGLNYHYGLFRQVFQNRLQTETKDTWLDKPSWLRKTDFLTTIHLGDTAVTSRMYELDVLGYSQKKTTLRLFDLEQVNEALVQEGIDFDQHALHENLTLFLYPDDSTEQGVRLRFAQQYFMVASGLAWILHQHHDHLDELEKHAVIQINDTHPSMVILLLIEALMREGMSFETAYEKTTAICAYTNHTILAEALETWPLDYFAAMDQELVNLIERLQDVVRSRSDNPEVAILDAGGRVHMAALAIHFSFSTNGVAALHTDILIRSELKDFYDLYPHKFNNKTNGITFRRWLQYSNRSLTDFLSETIGDGFKRDAMQLEQFLAYKDDREVQRTILNIKQQQKLRLASYLHQEQGIIVDPESVFDIQIKRLHEYKRQQLNLLYIIHHYLRIRNGFVPPRPVTFFFGSKAAPAYTIAKDIIHVLLTLSELIKQDERVRPYLKLVFVENYNVTKAEYLIPGCDISEQISLASKEASGTGNMKLMLNGALTLGTLDGANVEIRDLVGEENIYIFGQHSDVILEHYRKGDYVSKTYYDSLPELREAVDFLIGPEMLEAGSPTHLHRLYQELLNKDWFMTFIDFEEYVAAKDRMLADYENRSAWAEKMIANIAKAGFFSSDRTIGEYARDIWKVAP